MKLLRLFIANVSLWTIAMPACIAEDADLVLRGGTIVTVDRQQCYLPRHSVVSGASSRH
jgi:hypothetical protein